MLTLSDLEYAQWHRFHVIGDHTADGVVATTYRRWERVSRLGTAGPSWARRSIVGIDGLRARQDRLSSLLHRARDVLSSAIDELVRRGFAVVLANQEGIIIASWGTDTLVDTLVDAPYRAELAVGTRWDEETRGTNAIGTALAEHRPVSVIGHSHYLEGVHRLACYAALIEDTDDGEVVVLDITGPASEADPLLGVLVESLASALESAMQAARDQALVEPPPADPVQRALAMDHDRFLADASVTLGASLDLRDTTLALGELCLGSLADWCLIDLAGPTGALERACVVTRYPDKQVITEALQQHRVENHRPYLQLQAIEQRAPVIVRAVTPQLLAAVAYDPIHRALIEAMSPVSLMAIPLFAGDAVLGAMLCVSSEPARRYEPRHARLANELAQRGALAISNALLHRAVQEAADARAEVLAIVAHDLRGPLSAIGMSTELLQHRHAIGAADRSMRSIQRSTKQMSRLIEDLLEASRGSGDRLVLDLHPTRVGSLLDDALELARPLLTRRRVSLALSAVPSVCADRERILQVLMNLIGNAVKFTTCDARITIGACCEDGGVRIWVRDTGPGLAAEHAARVFERFWKGKRDDHRGAGLGLYISRRIVEDHGGRIGVDSTPGDGATFWFTLPAAAPPAPA